MERLETRELVGLLAGTNGANGDGSLEYKKCKVTLVLLDLTVQMDLMV
jgi:hypothetical protein